MKMLPTFRPRSSTSSARARVRVAGGYQPDVVYGRPGAPLAITFLREESAPCSERVLFPALGKSAMLPPYEEVTVELPAQPAGQYEFTCQMGMLRGRVVIEEESRMARSTP